MTAQTKQLTKAKSIDVVASLVKAINSRADRLSVPQNSGPYTWPRTSMV